MIQGPGHPTGSKLKTGCKDAREKFFLELDCFCQDASTIFLGILRYFEAFSNFLFCQKIITKVSKCFSEFEKVPYKMGPDRTGPASLGGGLGLTPIQWCWSDTPPPLPAFQGLHVAKVLKVLSGMFFFAKFLF